MRNVALAANGSVATASSFQSDWAPALAIDGNRGYQFASPPWWWADNTEDVFPDWIQVAFAQPETIHEIDIITSQDDYVNPLEPTETMTFTLYGITDFRVEYWDDGWTLLEQITGNNLVWRKLTFPPVTTSAIRITVDDVGDHKWCRIAEIEVWAEGDEPVEPFTRVAFPQFGGVKFRTANIVPRPGDSGNGGFGIPANFYDLLYEWGTEGPTSAAWTESIKPQIDAIKAVGGNCVRFMFDATVRVGDATHHGAAAWQGAITQTQLEAMLDQLITYLASQGMYFYATATEIRPVNTANLSSASLLAYINEYVTIVSSPAYHNVIGIDLLQEVNGDGNSSVTMNNFEAVMAEALSARIRPLPVTCSCNGDRPANPALESFWGRAAVAGVDYFDYHRYWQGEPNRAHLDILVDNDWDIPVVMGEIGIPYSGRFQTGPAQGDSLALSTAYYDGIVAIGSRYDVQLVGIWSGITHETTPPDEQDYGLCNINFEPRNERVSRFALLPDAIQPRDTAHDPGPEMEFAPEGEVSGQGSVDLTWVAASGGSDVSYEAQYVEVDADGFPVAEWASGTATISGLTEGVSYAFRIKVSDGVTGEFRYSPWLTLTMPDGEDPPVPDMTRIANALERIAVALESN